MKIFNFPNGHWFTIDCVSTRVAVGVVLLFMCLFINCPLLSQFNAYENGSQRIAFYSLRLADGKFEMFQFSIGNIDDTDNEINFLENDVARAELDMTVAQTADLDDVLKRFKAQRRELIVLVNENDRKITSELNLQIQKVVESFRHDLKRIFLANQIERFQQLQFRYLVRQLGIRQTIAIPKVSEHLNISETDQRQLFEVSLKSAVEYEDIVKSHKAKYFEAMTESLDPPSKEIFDSVFREFVEQRLPPLDVILWQIENADELHRHFEESGNSGKEFSGLFLPNKYVVDITGRFVGETSTSGLSKASVAKRMRVEQLLCDYAYCKSLLFYLTDSALAAGLDLTNEQLAGIEQLSGNDREFHQALLQRRTDSGLPGYSGDESTESAQREIREMKSFAAKTLGQLDQILTQHQKESLGRLAEGAEFVLGGFNYAVEFGNAGKRLKLSAKEIERIRKAGRAFSIELKQTSEKIEQEIMEKIFAVLNDEQRKKLDSLMGQPLEYSSCNLELLLVQLKGGN